MTAAPDPVARPVLSMLGSALVGWVAMYAVWWAFVGSWSPWAAV